MKDILWQMLLHLRQSVHHFAPATSYCHLSSTPALSFDQPLAPEQEDGLTCLIVWSPTKKISIAADIVLVQDSDYHFHIQQHSSSVSIEDAQFFQQYLPYSLLSQIAKKQQSAVAVAHFAQSLDGKIATASGHSKWIGNTENLIHAHRMRALCDAILIGSGTLQADQPRLTVRHVQGENPTRIILGSSATDYACLKESCSKEIIVIASTPPPVNGPVRFLQLPRIHSHINSRQILRRLFAEGFHSVYIEGGPTTTSRFLRDGAIDILQLHFAPILLGGGIPCIQLPEVGQIDEARQFRQFWYHPVGDAMMFTGVF